jgi:hypothetical protein
MKVTRNDTSFKPVVITLESEGELEALITAIGISGPTERIRRGVAMGRLKSRDAPEAAVYGVGVSRLLASLMEIADGRSR